MQIGNEEMEKERKKVMKSYFLLLVTQCMDQSYLDYSLSNLFTKHPGSIKSSETYNPSIRGRGGERWMQIENIEIEKMSVNFILS